MKYFRCLLLILFIIGCTVNNESINVSNEATIDDSISLEDNYVDNNPVTVGLYLDEKLVKDLNVTVTPLQDIITLSVYFTNDEYVNDTNTKRNFNKYAQNYDDISNYKIGFMIEFSAEGNDIKKIITGPKDMYAASPYIYNYLYDDIHQPDGSWYSHVEENEVTEDTIYSSIKLFATKYVDTITTPITLTVFTYDSEDDFDEYGIYRGNSKYTITIKNET